MRPSFVPSSGPGTLRHAPSLAGFITNMCGFRFSVHTGLLRTSAGLKNGALRPAIDFYGRAMRHPAKRLGIPLSELA